MDLFQNPFFILNATSRDHRRKIMELAEERSLLLNSHECMQARSDLMNPSKRLSAEIAWLPGLGPKRAIEAISILKNSAEDILNFGQVTPITKTNLLAAGLSQMTASIPDDVSEWILELAWAFEDIDPEELCTIINEERIVSGFPELSDILLVEEEVRQRRNHYRHVIKSALDNLPANHIVEAVTMAVETATDNGEKQGPILIADLVDFYESEAQSFIEKETKNIEVLVEKLKAAADEEQPDSALAFRVNQLIDVVKNWDKVAQPIQVSTKSQGLDHEASQYIADIVRDVAIHLFNEHGKLDFSQQLTNMLQEVFAEVVVVAERTEEDAKALDELAEKRVQMIADAKKGAEEWRKEITYEAEIGLLFKERLRISPDGIELRGDVWDLDSITRVRWGGTRHSVNGIPTGTTYSILIGNNNDSTEITLKRKEIYSNFIDKLWSAVCVRILSEFLEGLGNGKRYPFGSAVIDDNGIVLEKIKWFGEDEHVHCPWNELVIWNDPGTFCIGKKENKKLSASFSYQAHDNIHILEAAIRMFWKRGGNQLSSLLHEQ